MSLALARHGCHGYGSLAAKSKYSLVGFAQLSVKLFSVELHEYVIHERIFLQAHDTR
jgi:hypothetical protein